MRESPTLEGTESQINKCQKATRIFMELRESAAQVKHTGHRATNEAWHFNQIRRVLEKKSSWILARTL